MIDPWQANSNFGKILSKWLSFKGRISQQDFWIFYVLPFALLYLFPIPLSSLFAIWVLLVGTVKRLHDCNSSGRALIPFGILSVVLLVIVMVILFFSFLGGMTGNVSASEFKDQLVILGLPIMALLLLPIYAGLKPSSPEVNKYGSRPAASTLSRGNKRLISVGFLILSIVSLGFRGVFQPSVTEPKEPTFTQSTEPMATTISEAIKSGDIVQLRSLLENGVDPNSVENHLVLLEAVKRERIEAVNLLLDHGAELNSPINRGALLIAVENEAFIASAGENKTFDMTRFLIGKKISLEQITNAKQWVEDQLPNYKAPDQLESRNRLLEIQRLLASAEKNSEK